MYQQSGDAAVAVASFQSSLCHCHQVFVRKELQFLKFCEEVCGTDVHDETFVVHGQYMNPNNLILYVTLRENCLALKELHMKFYRNILSLCTALLHNWRVHILKCLKCSEQ